jgi:hypothetical protein
MKTNRNEQALPTFADHDEEPTARLDNPLCKWWLEQAPAPVAAQVAS